MKYKVWKAMSVLALVCLAILVFGSATMYLWNWLMPAIFGLHTVTFVQALGLLLLGKILFGGFHRHSGGRGWKRRMERRWAQMSPEERERFRAGMQGRCGFSPRSARTYEPSPEQGTL